MLDVMEQNYIKTARAKGVCKFKIIMKHAFKNASDLGVDALISQLFFDNDVFCRFRDRARVLGVTVPIIAGIMPITSAAQIDKMVTMCGATVPDRVRRFVDAYGHNSRAIKEAGIAYATEQIVNLLPIVQPLAILGMINN